MTSSSTNPPEETGANGARKAGHYYSYGIPYLSVGNYPGKLIAIEGTAPPAMTEQAAPAANDPNRSMEVLRVAKR